MSFSHFVNEVPIWIWQIRMKKGKEKQKNHSEKYSLLEKAVFWSVTPNAQLTFVLEKSTHSENTLLSFAKKLTMRLQ